MAQGSRLKAECQIREETALIISFADSVRVFCYLLPTVLSKYSRWIMIKQKFRHIFATPSCSPWLVRPFLPNPWPFLRPRQPSAPPVRPVQLMLLSLPGFVFRAAANICRLIAIVTKKELTKWTSRSVAFHGRFGKTGPQPADEHWSV